jgi:hypothetical protein
VTPGTAANVPLGFEVIVFSKGLYPGQNVHQFPASVASHSFSYGFHAAVIATGYSGKKIVLPICIDLIL